MSWISNPRINDSFSKLPHRKIIIINCFHLSFHISECCDAHSLSCVPSFGVTSSYGRSISRITGIIDLETAPTFPSFVFAWIFACFWCLKYILNKDIPVQVFKFPEFCAQKILCSFFSENNAL